VSWRSDAGELFYVAADQNLMAVPVRVRPAPSGSTFEPGVPKSLFQVPISFLGNTTIGIAIRRVYSVATDGRRFLVSKPIGEATAPPITVSLNWPAGLPK